VRRLSNIADLHVPEDDCPMIDLVDDNEIEGLKKTYDGQFEAARRVVENVIKRARRQ